MANDHNEEGDGCDHGHTGKECRPDPNDHGKDCLIHGHHGGVNEDHCTTTTTHPVTTTTTRPTTTSSTTSTTVKPTGSTTTTVPNVTTSTTALTTSNTTVSVGGVAQNPSDLALTGSTAEPILALGLLFIAAGLWVKRLATR